ncbi:hypothetical protein KAE78_07300 [Microbacterium sp. NIBRBAC000506063]|nr:hypothetical protein KAE78_07300 [Microbacterium sp. NIBRBAC000506063]
MLGGQQSAHQRAVFPERAEHDDVVCLMLLEQLPQGFGERTRGLTRIRGVLDRQRFVDRRGHPVTQVAEAPRQQVLGRCRQAADLPKPASQSHMHEVGHALPRDRVGVHLLGRGPEDLLARIAGERQLHPRRRPRRRQCEQQVEHGGEARDVLELVDADRVVGAA